MAGSSSRSGHMGDMGRLAAAQDCSRPFAAFARAGRGCYSPAAARATGPIIKKCPGGHIMAKFLITASYTSDGLKGLQKDKASGRRDAVRQACESVGGKLECMYYAFGDDDVVIIADLPDNVT